MKRAGGARSLIAGAALLLLVGGAVVAPYAGSNAQAAGTGSMLLNESFSGSSVADVRAIGLNDACLTNATVAPGAGVSNLGPCAKTELSPAPGGKGYLQLTDASNHATGGMVFDRAMPSSAGIEIEFDQAQYGSRATWAADGIGFFLSDGSRQLTQTGADGGSLGYAPNVGRKTPGIAGGYLGVGFDTWGNYIGDYEGRGTGCTEKSPFPQRVPNNITLRGPGEGFNGYCLLAHTPVDATDLQRPVSLLQGAIHSTDGPEQAIRNVRVSVSPGDFPEVKVDVDFTGTKTNYERVIDYTMTKKAPPTYKFGFSGSTGDVTDVHLVSNVQIRSIDTLEELNLVKQVDNTVLQPEAYAAGDTVPYQFVVTNTGAEPVTDVKVSDPLIRNVSCPATSLGSAGGATASMVCTGSLVVTEAQANDVSGQLVNTATVTGLSSLGNTLTSSSSAMVDVIATPVVPDVAGLSLVKSAKLNDLNGNGLADAGETIDYSFVVENTGNVTVTGVSVSDPMLSGVTCEKASLAPGESTTCSSDAPYVVTEADVIAGSVKNIATANGTPPGGVDPVDPPTDEVVTPTTPAAAALSLVKSAKLNDLNGNGLADAGETIDYSFVVENTGNVTVTGVSVSDPMLSGVTCEKASLAPGESTTCSSDAPYVVTEADVIAGSVKNIATANGTPPGGVDPVDPPTDEVVTPTTPAAAALSLEKTATVTGRAKSDPAEVGDKISYGFVVTNDGNVSLADIVVSDPMIGDVVCEKTELAPSESMTCSGDTYTVTAQDGVAGFVLNVAVATATAPEGVNPPEEATGEARVKVIPPSDGGDKTPPPTGGGDKTPKPTPGGELPKEAPLAKTGGPEQIGILFVGVGVILAGVVTLMVRRRRAN